MSQNNEKNIYLDINGDIINEIFNLEPENRIDKILESIIESDKSIKTPKKDKEPKKKDEKKEKKAEKKNKKTRIIKIRRTKKD